MVVNEEHGSSGLANRCAKDFTRMNQTCRERSHGDHIFGHQSVTTVAQQHVKGLPPRTREAGHEMSMNVVGALDSLPGLERFCTESLRDLYGRRKRSGLRDADARHQSELAKGCIDKAPDSANTTEEDTSPLSGVAATIPRPQHESDEFYVAQCVRAQTREALAGEILGRRSVLTVRPSGHA